MKMPVDISYINLRKYLILIGLENSDIDVLIKEYSLYELEEMEAFALIMIEEFDNERFIQWFENTKTIKRAKTNSLAYIMLVHYFEFISSNTENKKHLRSLFLKLLVKKNMFFAFSISYSKTISNARLGEYLNKTHIYIYIIIALAVFYLIRQFILDNNILLTINFLLFVFVILNRKNLISFAYNVVLVLKIVFLTLEAYLIPRFVIVKK